MSNELFAAALGVEQPWCVKDVRFDAGKRLLTIAIDFIRRPSATGISISSSTNAISKCARPGSGFPMAGWL